MKALSAWTLGILILIGMASPEDATAQFPRGNDRGNNRDRVCVYQDIQYQGWEQCYYAGDEVANLDGRRNHISSIRVYGGARVTVYDETNFRGGAVEFDSDVRDLGLRSQSGSRSWSDRIESLRVSSDYDNRDNGEYRDSPGNGRGLGRGIGRGNGRGLGRGVGRGDRDSRDGICVYEHANYQGRSECWSAGDDPDDLARMGNWSDRISSIQIIGDAIAFAYRDIGFRGARLFIDQDIPNLARAGLRGAGTWNDQISSVQVEMQRGR